MPFKDSRQGPGTLLLGTPGLEVGVQASAVTLTPSINTTDGTPTLAEPEPPPEQKTSYTLDGTAIQDFTEAAGFQRYCYDHDGEETEFVWTPNTADAAVLTGTVVLSAFPMGGNVGEQVTTDWTWPCVGKPVWTGGAVTAATAKMKAAAK